MIELEDNKEVESAAHSESLGADFGDVRLNARFSKTLCRFALRPMGSIPESNGDWASTKGTYRFLGNPQVTPKKILAPHLRETILRCQNSEDVLVLGDTTLIDFSTRKETLGLGPLGGGGNTSDPRGLGLLCHTSFAVSASGIPLGVVKNELWSRDPEGYGKRKERCRKLSIEEKESRKWLVTLKATKDLRKSLGEDQRAIAVFDREGDIYSVLGQALTQFKVDFLIRATFNRRVTTEGGYSKIWDLVATKKLGLLEVVVPRGRKQESRTARLTVYCSSVEIMEPLKRAKGETSYGELTITALHVREESPPDGVKPLEWKLLTSLPVESVEEAARVVDFYKRRWNIEQLFRILKSGCKIEKRQLQTADRLKNCITMDLIVAWLVFYLTIVGRETPDIPCTVIFEDCEWQAVWIYHNKNHDHPKTPPSMREMTRMIGKLGGHLGRKGDGNPGSEALWRGLQRLPDLSGMWCIFSDIAHPPESRQRLL